MFARRLGSLLNRQSHLWGFGTFISPSLSKCFRTPNFIYPSCYIRTARGVSMMSESIINRGAAATDDALVWIDCEMTGLNPDTDEVLEIYCLLTTGDLEVIDPEGYHAVVHWPASRLEHMDEWCTSTHGNSGLTAAILASTTTPEQAADGLYDYVTKFIPKPLTALLAGNSVHADREFLRKQPYSKVMEHLHYRILDVSSIKEAARRWSPQEVVAGAPAKKGSHKAKDDILESIEEARYYRQVIFNSTAK